MKDMYLHSAELKNAVTVTQNGSTFLLVWTHVSRYGVNWLYCCYVCKVLTVVMQSSQFSNFQLFTLFYFILLYLFTDCFLPLTPSGCATASVGGYVPVFFFFPIRFLGFRIRQRTWPVKPEWFYFGLFVYFSLKFDIKLSMVFEQQ